MATSFSAGGSRSNRREPPTMGKQLVIFITCGCESSANFFVIYKTGREPTPYELLDPTTKLIEPPGSQDYHEITLYTFISINRKQTNKIIPSS
jgi:hypothetical protein